MNTHLLQRPRTLRRSRSIGRGGKRGKTSGRGTKGQIARTGNSTRPELRDIIKKYPKRRGFGKNRADTVVPGRKPQVVNLDAVSKYFNDGDEVTPKALLSRKLVRAVSGRAPQVKILARGELTKKLTFTNLSVSAKVRTVVEAAGGKVTQ